MTYEANSLSAAPWAAAVGEAMSRVCQLPRHGNFLGTSKYLGLEKIYWLQYTEKHEINIIGSKTIKAA